MQNNKLHTDIIEEKFGGFSIIILSQDEEIRIVNIVDKNEVPRTRAVSRFLYKGDDDDIVVCLNIIKKGGSIGKVFRENGFKIKKNILKHGYVKIDKKIQEAFDVSQEKTSFKIYDFLVCKDNGYIDVIRILEIYSPILEINFDMKDRVYSVNDLYGLISSPSK